ncbi:MAG: hypothetical protein IJZ19_09030 [Lentisphaeria bacterium]|jgi:hypothetical protein|nr:hypothetical protein [Lentisphaeria bacterium]
MSLLQWQNNGWLRPHVTDKNEIANLLAIVDRDMEDAAADGISDDWKFGIAYNAALKLATIMLYAAGFKPEKNLAHYRTLLALEFTIGVHRKDDAAYLDACRVKRNIVEYDNIGGASHAEAIELLDFVKELKEEVLEILAEKYPVLLS